jgi:DNA-directed RNA polymerase subunit E'/Rpb7
VEKCSASGIGSEMFELLEVQDLLEVIPSQMPAGSITSSSSTGAPSPRRSNDGLLAAVEAAIAAKYSFKAIPGHHCLCVGVAEVTRVGLARLTPGSPSAWVGATFSLLVMRPRLHERLKGRIAKQDNTGVFVTMDFFSHVFVPAHLLKDPSEYDPARRRWLYVPEDEPDADAGASQTTNKEPAARQFAPYEDGSEVVFSVHSVVEPQAVEHDATKRPGQVPAPTPPAVHVLGSFVDPGLGPVSWFDFGENAGGGDEDDTPLA